MAKPPARAWAALGVAILAVSTGALFVRGAEAPALAKAAWRVGLAAAVALGLAASCGALRDLRRIPRALWIQAGLSGAFLALHFATWISSLDRTTVAASALLVTTAPVWVALLAPWLTGDRLGRRGWVGVALALSGAALAGAGEFALSPRAFVGDLLALAGGIFSALYLMMGRRVRRDMDLLTYLAATYTTAALILWIVVWITGTPARGFTPATWGAFFGMALISQHLGHGGYNYALRYLTPGVLAVTLLAEPLLSSLGAWLLFGEVPPARLAYSAALILPGIWLVAREEPAEEL